MAMTNLKLSTSELSAGTILGDVPETPEYPYGLTITLNQEVLNRLGMDLPKVGATVSFTAQSEVVGTSKDEQGRHELRLQITDIELHNTRDENMAQALFGNG